LAPLTSLWKAQNHKYCITINWQKKGSFLQMVHCEHKGSLRPLWSCVLLDLWNIDNTMCKFTKNINLIFSSIWQFDSRPLKVGNHADFLLCRWHATYCWKALDKGYNFALVTTYNWRCARKVMGLQSCGSPSCENFGTPTWESRDKMLFGCGPRGEAHSIL